MKLIIQIPCLNEEETLAEVLADIPESIPGIDEIETMIIDDGSTDGTVDLAHRLGVDHIIKHPRNMGLAKAFQSGIEEALRQRADIIVNTDGDHQYPGSAIPDLVELVRSGQADIALGDRQVQTIDHFSPIKKFFQAAGNVVVRSVSGTDINDAVSGFRAYSREAALRLTILTRFSYTLDTIIQAGNQGMVIKSVPVTTNGPTRPSRLQRSLWHFIKAQAATILRLYVFYEPLRTFTYIASPLLLTGSALLVRFFWAYFTGGGSRFVQSVSIGIGLLVVGMLIFLVGVQADIANKHRMLTQETLYRLKKLELEQLKSLQNQK
ncbi:MAG: glycosyltransferase involved in cell wall biosynthesis [Candidatus Promineifilaceae bacterium]